MDARRLAYFTCILEEGGITAAAQRLRLTQPALTRSMKLLEEELGVILFERRLSGITATAYGEALYARAKAILSEMQRAEEEIATLKGMAGEHFRIGAPPTLTGSIVARAVGETRRRFPELQIRVQEGQSQVLFRALQRHELDVCLAYAGNVAQEHPFRSRLIFRDQLKITASAKHPLTKLETVTLPQLATYPWCAAATVIWPVVERMFESVGIKPMPRPIDPGGSVQFLKALVSSSDCLTLLPRHAMTGELARGELSVLPVKGVSLDREIIALSRREPKLPMYGRAFIASLIRTAAALLQEAQ